MSNQRCIVIFASMFFWSQLTLGAEDESKEIEPIRIGKVEVTVVKDCLSIFWSAASGFASFLPALSLVSREPQLQNFMIVGDEAWRQSLQIVKGFVQREHFDFRSPNSPYHSSTEEPIEDLTRIRQQAAAALLGHKDMAGAAAAVKMVYFLHLLDDVVDRTDLLNLPVPFLKKLQNPRGFREVYFSNSRAPAVQSMRNTSHNLITIVRLMKRAIRQRFGHPNPRDMHTRLRAVEDSAFIIFLASAASRHYGDDTDNHEWYYHLNILKLQSLYMLKSKDLRGKFMDFPPALFYLIAKTPMNVMLALESSEYDNDNAFVWSMLFSPFFYNFQKERKPHQEMKIDVVMSALREAADATRPNADPYFRDRINQLKYMLITWPKLPSEIADFYESFIFKAGGSHDD